MGAVRDDTNYHVGDVIAFKQFRIAYRKRGLLRTKSYDELRLVGANHSYEQEYGAGINHAQCPYHEHYMMKHPLSSLPDEKCSCGFYALRTQEDWSDQVDPDDLIVDAVVRLSGKVILGELGYRAERLEILAYAPRFRDPLTSSLLTALQESEFQSTRMFSSSDAMVSEFLLEETEDASQNAEQDAVGAGQSAVQDREVGVGHSPLKSLMTGLLVGSSAVVCGYTAVVSGWQAAVSVVAVSVVAVMLFSYLFMYVAHYQKHAFSVFSGGMLSVLVVSSVMFSAVGAPDEMVVPASLCLGLLMIVVHLREILAIRVSPPFLAGVCRFERSCSQ